jgi:hypothetical protein
MSNHEHQQEKEVMHDEKSGDATGLGTIYVIENSTNIHLNPEIKLIHAKYLPN